MRITLYELIKEGAKTAPEMAEILKENRLNLYHHLAKLEDAKLIESRFGDGRTKIYQIMDIKPLLRQQLMDHRGEADHLKKTTNIILNVPENEKTKIRFNELVKELVNISKVHTPDDLQVLQVHLIFQHQKIVDSKRKQIKETKKRRSKSM